MVVKFDGGDPVIVCDNCRKIYKRNLRKEVVSTKWKEKHQCEECRESKNEIHVRSV